MSATIEQMITAVRCAHAWIPEHRDALDSAVEMLRAMQGKEPADPPPSEDALLREIDAVRAEVRDTFRQMDDIPADHTVRKIDSALRRARDRIAADAKDHARLIAELLRQEDRIDAAEARAHGLEADARRYRWLRGNATWGLKHDLRWYLPRHGVGNEGEQLDAAIDANIAALARPEPEGNKEKP